MREKLAELIGRDVQWADDCVGRRIRSKARQPASCCCSRTFASTPARRRTIPHSPRSCASSRTSIVNDAFGACHRAHASIDALPRLFPKDHTAGGLLLARELEFLQKVTNISERPFVALMGGAKIAGKIEPLEALVKLADKVLIGGGMANTFLAASGIAMGGSLVDQESLDVARRISSGHARAEVVLPVDLVVADDMNAPTKIETVDVAGGLTSEQKAFDIGPKTVTRYESELRGAKTIFWNGPMGVFEKEQFAKGTMAMASAVANATGAITVVGGGESVEAVNASGFADRITHISTGGGASLEFISGETLPGVAVLT